MTAVLDDVLPVYRHRVRHTARIAATPEAVWSALHTVSAGDLRLTRVLWSIRALPGRLRGARRPPAGLPADRGFIEAFMGSSAFANCSPFRHGRWWLATRGNPGGCAAGRSRSMSSTSMGPCFASAGLSLDRASSSRRSATAPGSAPRPACNPPTLPRPRVPAAGWAIRAGSGLIRRDMLHAVRRCAELDATPPTGDADTVIPLSTRRRRALRGELIHHFAQHPQRGAPFDARVDASTASCPAVPSPSQS